jgi:hypothetical protein
VDGRSKNWIYMSKNVPLLALSPRSPEVAARSQEPDSEKCDIYRPNPARNTPARRAADGRSDP